MAQFILPSDSESDEEPVFQQVPRLQQIEQKMELDLTDLGENRVEDRVEDDDHYDDDHYDDDHQEDEEGEQDEDSTELQNERDFYARASNRGGISMAISEGMNPRLYYALQNTDRSESDIFLDKLEEYYKEKQSDIRINRSINQFTLLLSKHPHPRFLNIPLCMIMEYFFNGKTYNWNEAIYKKLKDYTNYNIVDVIRYIALFNIYSTK